MTVVDSVVFDDAPFVREWPAWAVPAAAIVEWVELQFAIDQAPRPPVCRREPEAWWSTAASGTGAERQVAAVQACSWCPVLEACRAYAVAARERYGVWGGTTPEERRALGVRAS